MLARYVYPKIEPLCHKAHVFLQDAGLPAATYKIGASLSFAMLPIVMALQMNHLGLLIFLLHLFFWGVYSSTTQHNISATTHMYGLSALTIFATAFGVSENYGMPVAFLFVSWLVMAHVSTLKTKTFQLVGPVEVGVCCGGIIMFPHYIPAIAILFGLACVLSAALAMILRPKE
jgi:hypothetical protein